LAESRRATEAAHESSRRRRRSAGLYFASLMKAGPQTRITVFERNRPDDTFGFGVVSDDARHLESYDREL
jgi:hypothetical protein